MTSRRDAPAPDPIDRRRFLAAAGIVPLAVLACRPRLSFSCTEAPDLTTADSALRISFGYNDRSVSSERTCEKCLHYVAANGSSSCGTCRLVKGPIHPEGSCNVWVARS